MFFKVLQFENDLIFASLFGCPLSPVSYTHLDVYKRQEQELLNFRIATGGIQDTTSRGSRTNAFKHHNLFNFFLSFKISRSCLCSGNIKID